MTYSAKLSTKLFALLIILFFGSISFAQISNLSVPESGRSNFDIATFTIYGGIAGDVQRACINPDNCNADGGTCDNCCDDGVACNPRHILTSTQLILNFNTTIPNTEPTLAYDNTEIVEDTEGTNNNAGNASLTVDWDDICDAMENPSCANNDAETFTLTVGEETLAIRIEIMGNALSGNSDCLNNASGFCNWEITRGNEKVAITGGQALGQTDDLNQILVMYGEDFSRIDPSALVGGRNANNQLLDWDDENNRVVSESIIDLQNGTSYDFRTAMVDDAGNFYNFFTALDFDMSATNPVLCNNAAGAVANIGGDPFTNGCQFSGRPGEVAGLLEDDLNCFITTAAYGSSFSNKVETFRTFRNTFMAKNKVGIYLIHKYYNIGPKLARNLYGNDTLRSITRAALYPVWVFAALSLKIGLTLSLLLLLLTAVLLFLIFNKRKIFS